MPASMLLVLIGEIRGSNCPKKCGVVDQDVFHSIRSKGGLQKADFYRRIFPHYILFPSWRNNKSAP